MTSVRDRLQAALDGRYAIEQELGHGGMASVFRARDLRHGRTVALKVLHPELAAALGPERFQREIRVSARLQHPNILALHDSGEADGLLYYVMPLVDGESLRDRLRREGQLSVSEAVRIAGEVARALGYAHRAGIVHRDIKPENLLLDRDGRVHVADFGIARAGADEPLTQTGLSIGTPAYMSPEQASGSPVDARTDIYGLGSVLYELLVGEPPFTGPTPQTVIAKRFTDPAPSPRRLRPEVPEALDRTVLRALARTPADRHPDGNALAAALADPSVLSGAVTVSVSRLPHGRVRKVAAAAALAGVVVASLLMVYEARDAPFGAVAPITLAVLPFHELAGSEAGPLAIGIPDAIIARLASAERLRLRPTSAILRFEHQSVEPQAAGRALKVDYVLDGTLQQSPDRLRAQVQLVRVRDGRPLWAEHYDLARQDLLVLQDSIASRVTRALPLRLTLAEQARLYRRYTSDPAAYELYLRGRAALPRLEKEQTLAAVAAFEEALSRDSTYALARAGLALAAADMHLRFAEGPDVAVWGRRARVEAGRAIALDSTLAEAHLALAAVARKSEFDWDATLAHSRRALDLNPSLDLAHYFRAAAFYHLGALDEAAEEVRIAVEINPERSIERVRTEGVIAFLKGEFQRAYALLGEVHRRSSGRVADFYYGEATFYVGDTTAAEKVLDELAHTPSASATARGRAALAAVLAARGARAESRRLLEAVSAPGYMDHHVAYAIGTAYAQLGDPAEARQWLARAADTGFPCYPWFQIDPLLAPLRPDPEFRRWLEGVRLAWEEMIQSLGPSAERSTRGSAVPPRSTRGP